MLIYLVVSTVKKTKSFWHKNQTATSRKLIAIYWRKPQTGNLLEKTTDRQCESLFELDTCKETIKGLNLLLEEKDLKICELADSNVTNSNVNLETKKDNIYSDDICLCVIELAGLEVAAEKVSPVIQTVLKHLTKIQVPKHDLPNATTSQTIN
ncbi:hypothetical protein DPMN_084595 [Dreissena polymorpha]|uniref:Uncharacterized protein n=1 Tax=Dreissena polymorpha TaxID=45954 RepID=A0A9D3YAU3_DREPO|nr:hypothetical protein DPMN_084595 [Dreissena polymorpha]